MDRRNVLMAMAATAIAPSLAAVPANIALAAAAKPLSNSVLPMRAIT